MPEGRDEGQGGGDVNFPRGASRAVSMMPTTCSGRGGRTGRFPYATRAVVKRKVMARRRAASRKNVRVWQNATATLLRGSEERVIYFDADEVMVHVPPRLPDERSCPHADEPAC